MYLWGVISPSQLEYLIEHLIYYFIELNTNVIFVK